MQFTATHTPHATISMGSTSRTTIGPSLCAGCQVNYTTPTLTVPYTEGGPIEVDSTSITMVCSVAGLFFNFGSLFNWEVAFTRFVTSGYILDTEVAPHQRDYYVGPYCSQPTAPPDWNPTSPPAYFITYDPPGVPTDIVDGRTLCTRIGTSGPWQCLPFGKFDQSYNAPYILGNCTHNP